MKDKTSPLKQRNAELNKKRKEIMSEIYGTSTKLPYEVKLTLHLDQVRRTDEGGMGIICQAIDIKLGGRKVALKFMEPLSDQERFLHEAKVTGRMAHPGILPVYGYGRTTDNIPFYAMRYVVGTTLEQKINTYHSERKNQSKRKQNTALRPLLNHFVAVANTIAYAHERGVVHCDLKPRNILLGTFGETYVIDWGIAAGVSSSQGPFTSVAERREAHGLGTIVYAHPEQLEGKSPPRRAWDIYSLGVILYKILTNKTPDTPKLPPTDHNDIKQTTTTTTSKKLISPRTLNPNIPPPLESLCQQALNIDSEHGSEHCYQSAKEIANDLQSYLSDEPVTSHTEALWEKALRWQRNHQGVSVLITTLILFIITCSILLFHYTE